MRHNLFKILLSFMLLLLTSFAALSETDRVIKVGIMEGLDNNIWQTVKSIAATQHLPIELMHFSDYSLLNEALENGDIDANAFQHKPYLDSQIKQRGYNLVSAGHTMLMPIAIYSHKINSIETLHNDSEIGIPNDPTNEDRALRLLAKLGLIELGINKDNLATKGDITKNPKNIKFIELNAGMLGRALGDFSAAVINTDWAISSKLNLSKDRIAAEDTKDNPYDNIIAVRAKDKDAAWVKTLISSFQNPQVRAKIKEVYGSYVTTSW